MRRTRTPRYITLARPATCAETGKQMPKGARALYFPSAPSGKGIFHPDSKAAYEYNCAMADEELTGNY